MNKRKLSKLLNKEETYTAILGDFDKQKGRTLLTDVRHQNKLYADHIWISRTLSSKAIAIDSKVSFIGTAFMYNDKFGIRKEGLTKCKSFESIGNGYWEQMHKEKTDAGFKTQRKRKGR